MIFAKRNEQSYTPYYPFIINVMKRLIKSWENLFKNLDNFNRKIINIYEPGKIITFSNNRCTE